MIDQEKLPNALRALNSILIRARWMTHEANSPRLADLLDAAEILPALLAQEDDATNEFRAILEDISKQFEECSHVVEEFKQDCACGVS